MKYEVYIKEVHTVCIEVDANSHEEALDKAEDQYETYGIEASISGVAEFSHVMDSETWEAVLPAKWRSQTA